MRRCLSTVAAAALVLPFTAGPALAASDPVTGYWSRTALAGPVPVQPPDPVPDGGMWVAGDVDGPVAVSALRAQADPGSLVVALRLPVADSLGTPAVVVCPITDTWAPEQGGRLEAAPPADCSSPVEAVVEEDLLVVALPAALQGDLVDVLLRPADGSVFSLTLERATAEAVVTRPEPAPPSAFTLPPPPPPDDDSGSASAFGGTFPDLGLPAPAPAAEPLLPAPELPPPAAQPVPTPQAAPAPAPVALRRPPAAVDDRPVTLLATGLLVLLGALALRLAVQPVTPPRHLGGGARLSRAEAASPQAVPPTTQRGVGRFRAPRVRPPVRI